MKVLGIESSCDETAAAVVEDGRDVLSDVVRSQVDLHAKFGGPVPEVASRSHLEVIVPVIEAALERAELTAAEIDAVAVTNRPGLIGALLVGLSAAKAFALATGKPLVGVDHIAAHVYAAWMDADAPPRPPFVSLVVSGGHTSLFRHDGPFDSEEVGSTADDAAGEAFDKVAAILDLGYPGGPVIDRLAAEGYGGRFAFKRPLLSRDGIDFSFSGLKTAVLYRWTGRNTRHDPVEPTEANVKDMAASFQSAAVRGLVTAAFRAVERCGAQDLVIGGGCAANSQLRATLAEEAERRGVRLYLPEFARTTDNAVMIAGLGYHELARRGPDALSLDAYATGSR